MKQDLFSTEVSVYKNLMDNMGEVATLGDFLNGDYDMAVTRLRNETDPEERARMKQRLPAATISAAFPEGRGKDKPHTLSGLICVDVDGKDNRHLSPAEMKSRLKGCRQVAYCAYSCSGRGCFAIIRLHDATQFKGHFKALQRVFKERVGIAIDSQCGDVTRLRSAFYDPMPYVNQSAEEFTVIDDCDTDLGARIEGEERGDFGGCHCMGDDVQLATRYVEELERMGIDIAPTREEWLKVGFALHSLGEEGKDLFRRVSALWVSPQGKRTSERDIDNLWRNARKGKGITFATFIELCRQHGVTVAQGTSAREDFEGFDEASNDDDL